jgi:hypothetical protein
MEGMRMFEVGKYEKIGYQLFLGYQNFQEKYTSLASKWQIGFLLGLISDFKFTTGNCVDNVLELGVNHGVASLYMLKEGCKRPGFNLFGIDKGKDNFYGFAVFDGAAKKEQAHYHLHKDCTSFDIEEIVKDTKLDMVFIDAGHSHPHPIIDLIHVIPFLHEESIVLLHDVVDYMRPNAWGESFIYEGWDDIKYRSVSLDDNHVPNGDTSLGCIKITADKEKLYANIMKIVNISFRASPWKSDDFYLGINETHLDSLRIFMEKHYEQQFARMVFDKFLSNLKEYKTNSLLYIHETRFFNFLFERFFMIKPKSEGGKYDNLYTLKLVPQKG